MTLVCLAAVFVSPLAPDAAAWPEDWFLEEYVAPEVAVASESIGADEDSLADEPITVSEQFIEALNQLREDHDVAHLEPLDEMHEAAADWTETMVTEGRLAHADVIYAGLSANWEFAGENVGRGLTVESLMEAFMASETHRANILDERFTHVGVAALLHDDGRTYTTHRFAQFNGVPLSVLEDDQTDPDTDVIAAESADPETADRQTADAEIAPEDTAEEPVTEPAEPAVETNTAEITSDSTSETAATETVATEIASDDSAATETIAAELNSNENETDSNETDQSEPSETTATVSADIAPAVTPAESHQRGLRQRGSASS